MKPIASTLVLAGTLTVLATAVAAERSWQLELRAGVDVPIEDLGDVELDAGLGLEGSIAYAVTETIGLYAGWGFHHFGAELDGGDVDTDQSGYVLGVQYADALGDTGLDYRLRGALTYEHIELEDEDGESLDDTDHGAGFELGAAVLVPLNERLVLTPGLRYRFLSREIELAGVEDDEALDYVSLDVGIGWRF